MAYETHGPARFERPASLAARAAAWLRARLAELWVVAEVLHEHQWSAPWDTPSRPSEPEGGG